MSGEERKRQRTARSRSSEDCRRLLINFNRNATYQGKQASVKTGLTRILRLLKQSHRSWQLSRNALGLYPLVGGSAIVMNIEHFVCTDTGTTFDTPTIKPTDSGVYLTFRKWPNAAVLVILSQPINQRAIISLSIQCVYK